MNIFAYIRNFKNKKVGINLKQESLPLIYSYYGKELKFKETVTISDLQERYTGKYIIFLYEPNTRKCVILHSYNKPTPELEVKRREYIRNKIPVHIVQIGECK